MTKSTTIAMASSQKTKGGDKTDKKKMLVAVMGVVFVFITITSASSLMGSTPLYMVRMEQVSSKMNFLPTAVNGFTYTTESGCTVNYNATTNNFGAVPLMTTPGDTYCETCDPEQTCLGTCQEPTCPITCEGLTCEGTCYRHECPFTEWIFPATCDYPTCLGPYC